MKVLHVLALILFSMLGHSLGAVAFRKRREVAPDPPDILFFVAIIVVALSLRWGINRWIEKAIWSAVGFLGGALITTWKSMRVADAESHYGPAISKSNRRFTEAVKSLGSMVGGYQSRFLLTIFYFIVIAPFGLITRLSSNPLRTDTDSTRSNWVKREKAGTDIDSARGQA